MSRIIISKLIFFLGVISKDNTFGEGGALWLKKIRSSNIMNVFEGIFRLFPLSVQGHSIETKSPLQIDVPTGGHSWLHLPMVHMIIDGRFLTVIFQHRIFRACVVNHLIKDKRKSSSWLLPCVPALIDFNSKQQGRKACYSEKKTKKIKHFLVMRAWDRTLNLEGLGTEI